ncbi:phosphonate metabolism protein PhnM [Cytobacillus sp. Sa5YUA1]|uniref:Phosphonate metabolism protein PhnM n=1 Tax=Cytobacillus stercorigallinarum TaxID=2762240 RepID=A0ABR8QUZ0_9BACI|nr:phosphonate metabolism protein PhnM [Cytobacillus stercorigallinarum]MBD7939254.1 phosphonate metabolism protein PhnM [Cytobacillus stercorigallinarum]
MYIIHNGVIVLEDRMLEKHAVLVEDDRIKAIVKEDELTSFTSVERIDANGGYISPGFIDIHSDYIESIISPRPTSMMNVQMGLREAEKILIGHGITTMFHSLSFYREDIFTHKPMRLPQNVQKLVEAITETSEQQHLIRHRLHARFEIDNLDGIDCLVENLRSGKIHLLSFMDHTPGQGQYRNLEVFRETMRGYRDLTEKELNRIIQDRLSSKVMTIDMMKEIAEIAIRQGVSVASHDDDHKSKIDLVQSIGTTISEFPITLEVAKKAKQSGLYTIVGAPNILLGGSHSGNLSAAEAIRHQCADILCSDYYPSALLHSIFTLHEKYGQNLLDMFQMVTSKPAKAVNLDHEIGSIKPGYKADLLIIEKLDDGFPTVTLTMVNGVVITTTNYRKNKAMAEVVR